MNLSSPHVVAVGLDADVEPVRDADTAVPADVQVAGSVPRVVRWEWSPEDLDGGPAANPYDDARDARLVLDGDFVAAAWRWQANADEAAAGPDHYDVYVRRSLDGGLTWSTPPMNMSQLPGSAVDAVEPVLLVRDPLLVVGFGTAGPADGDLRYTTSTDLGATWSGATRTDPVTGARSWTADWLAQGVPHQAGGRLAIAGPGSVYGVWAQYGQGGNEVWARALRTYGP